MAEHLIYLTLLGILIAATITDLKYRLIYNRFILIGIVVTGVIRIFAHPKPWWDYVLTGFGVFIVLYLIAVFTDERSIGGGDVKLFGMMGLALGWEAFFIIFMLSHVLAAIYVLVLKIRYWKSTHRKTEFPFAPFILLATFIAYIYPFLLS